MSGFGQLTINMLKFFFSFKSVIALIFTGIVAVFIFAFGTTTAEGFGYASQLYILGGSLPIPFMLITTTYNSVFILGSIAVIMIAFQFSEFLLFGHVSHSVIGRLRNRTVVMLSYLMALFILALPISLIFIAHYFAIANSVTNTLTLVLIGWMYTIALFLMTTIILNVNAVRKVALFMMILAFLVGPATMMILSNFMKSLGGVWGVISYGTFELYSFLGLHMQLSRLIDFTIRSSFINWSEILGISIYLIPYVLIILFIYQRKELT
jgi:hypothetical protein